MSREQTAQLFASRATEGANSIRLLGSTDIFQTHVLHIFIARYY
jgi:hypothetical protein